MDTFESQLSAYHKDCCSPNLEPIPCLSIAHPSQHFGTLLVAPCAPAHGPDAPLACGLGHWVGCPFGMRPGCEVWSYHVGMILKLLGTCGPLPAWVGSWARGLEGWGTSPKGKTSTGANGGACLRSCLDDTAISGYSQALEGNSRKHSQGQGPL